jgi:hypothetical protein
MFFRIFEPLWDLHDSSGNRKRRALRRNPRFIAIAIASMFIKRSGVSLVKFLFVSSRALITNATLDCRAPIALADGTTAEEASG